jgi:hypothetical protein
MSDEVKYEEGGALEDVNLKDLKDKAMKLDDVAGKTEKTEEAKPEPVKEEKKTNDEDIFEFDDDDENTVTQKAPAVKEGEKKEEPVDDGMTPTAPDLGGGIIINNPVETKKEEGIRVGPLTEGSESMNNVKETLKELDTMTEVAKMVRAAKGERPKELTVVEILMDKVGMREVEFTDEERKKLSAAKRIKVVELDTKEVPAIKIRRPKSGKAKTLIQKAFSKQYAPFVAAASGYLGKMRNLSSLEVINLVSINANAKTGAEAILQKASLIYSKIQETSLGKFESFDSFCKSTAIIDINVMVYALVRATYPDDEEIMMNCANPQCTHKTRNAEGKVVSVPNQFKHSYKNTQILLSHKLSKRVQDASNEIYKASNTVEDALLYATEKSVLNTVKRAALGENQSIIIDIYCPSIYDSVEFIAKKVDMLDEIKDNDAYAPAINLATFIKSVMLKDEETGEYDVFDDIEDIIDIVYNMSEDTLEVINQLVSENVMDYQFKYGFKASDVVCPHCGQPFFEDVEIEIDQLLFLQAQHHMTND